MLTDEELYYSNDNLWICAKHVFDKNLRKYIEQHGVDNECCFFCDTDNMCDDFEVPEKMIQFDRFVQRILSGINYFYDDPANGLAYDGREGGYLGETYNTHELLNDVIGLDVDYEVIEKLVDSLGDEAWTDINFYGDSESDTLIYIWERFSNIVKHQVRYFFFDYKQSSNVYIGLEKPAIILESISEFIIELNLLTEYPHYNGFFLIPSALYRARHHHHNEIIDSAEMLGSAPVEFAAANRFSAEGISMFYGAEKRNTAIKEVIEMANSKSDVISVGKFTFARPVNLIDLRSIKVVGMFDIENLERHEASCFLNAFILNVSKRIGTSNERIEYIPSQVVTEYLHYVLSEKLNTKIDGIVYKSAIDSSDCYAIFAKNYECVNQGEEKKDSILALDKSSIETIDIASFKSSFLT